MKVNFDVTITQITWRDYNGIGEAVDLQDGNGRSIFKVTADATTPDPLSTSLGTNFIAHNGLRLPTLSSGVLAIYLS